MSVRVSFDLDENDLRHFRTMLQQARDAGQRRSRDEVLSGARGLIAAVRGVDAPHFVRQRIGQLSNMIAMIEDEEWQLGEEDVARVLSALVYFSEPEDLVPDHVPVLGFLDDAIMIELVGRELRHELQAYADFCAFRSTEQSRQGQGRRVTREQWLTAKREELHTRMHRRRRRRRWGSLFDLLPRGHAAAER